MFNQVNSSIGPPGNAGNRGGNESKETFLRQAEEARQQRLLDKKKAHAALIIQKHYRGWKTRQLEHTRILTQLISDLNSTNLISDNLTLTAIELYNYTKAFIFLDRFAASASNVRTQSTDLVLPRLCTHLVLSVQNGTFKHSYVSLIINKDLYKDFLRQSKRLLSIALKQMALRAATSNLKVKDDYFKFDVFLRFIASMTTVARWKCFRKSSSASGFTNSNKLVETMLNETARAYLLLLQAEGVYSVFNNCLMQHLYNYNLILTPENLTSIFTLSMETLKCSSYANNALTEFATQLLTIPASIKTFLSLKNVNADVILNESNLACRLYPLLTNTKSCNSFLDGKSFLEGISFLGNLCSLEQLDLQSFKLNVDNFLVIATDLIDYCSRLLNEKAANETTTTAAASGMIITWTPLFGYLKLKVSNANCFVDLLEQLRFLWSHKFIILLFFDKTKPDIDTTAMSKANLKSYLKSFFDKSNQQRQFLGSRVSIGVYRVCSFYKKILVLFTEPKIEILSALSFEEEFLLGLWKYFSTLGPQCGCRELIKILDKDKAFTHPIFDVLFVLASLVLYLFTIFDEEDVFTQQKILSQTDCRVLADFLNVFLYEAIMCLVGSDANSLSASTLERNSYFVLFHQLLIVMFDKDDKRHSMEQMEHFWILKDIKIKNFITDPSRNKANIRMVLNKIPHVIPLKYRIENMQADILREKEKLDYANVRIKVRRTRMIEDGIDQINSLPSLKPIIRVKMVNEFGLSEAGIDQDGVFKEFLLDVIKKLLNPEFNLFQVTDSDQQLYPSASSFYLEDHLRMFEFVGKLIGKAVYEGHVIDVQFAPFFLRQIIGCQQRSYNYSYLDDLASLDKELYKNLKYIKQASDVSDLELTFTHSEMQFGKLVDSELVPNGADIKVTDQNKIRYIHLLAHYKLHKQIRDQIHAFDKGFKSIIRQEWLNSFTLSEIQTLISGSTVDLDMSDLKENVQYWGGLHAQHRLIKWLWDIVEFDFTRAERALFLKFVTSSSKPPLLGFASLNPQFTIRSVENNEEEGTIYDASFKGFFKTMLNIGNEKETLRLPTSSTCFNLLKLPNYSKKSTLKERLRYAITSNSGFELS